MAGVVLTGETIRRLIQGDRPLVRGYRDLERQVQPNGIDLTLESIWRTAGQGQLGIEDGERLAAPRVAVVCGEQDFYELAAGAYVFRLNEVVDLPPDLMALARPRSSLLRSGVAVHNAVWDAGYTGRSEGLMVIYNPAGFRVRRHARILQLVFFRLEGRAAPYRGAYQGEHIERS